MDSPVTENEELGFKDVQILPMLPLRYGFFRNVIRVGISMGISVVPQNFLVLILVAVLMTPQKCFVAGLWPQGCNSQEQCA